jgi:hypothetical protein
MTNRKVFRVTVSSDEVQAFLNGCEGSEWFAFDTGERIMTDDGPDAEAVLLVEPVPTAQRALGAPLLH